MEYTNNNKMKKAKELMNWLESSTRGIDLPRSFSELEVKKLAEISKIEESGDTELLEKKVKEFKEIYTYKF